MNMSAASFFLNCPNAINLILPNLYLTSRDRVNNAKDLKELNITHILTIEDNPLDGAIQSQFVCKYKKLSDNMFNHLIDILEECIEFIDSAIQNSNKIVVHCLAGVSRSASVVIAYVMAKQKLTYKEAFELVKLKRPVRPNPGFIHQLQLFELMNFRVDKDSVIYKTFKLDNLTYLSKFGSLGRNIDFKDCYFPSEVNDTDTNIVFYNCKKCGSKLFNNKNLISHVKGQDFKGFFKKSDRLEIYKELAKNSDETKCNKGLNIEPLCWFMDDLEPNIGEIKCPQCNVRVGKFSWSGNPCDCGAWVRPAFYIDSDCIEIV